MATNNYQQALTAWNVRANQFAAAGIPPAQYTQLMHQDLAHVVQGGQPMTNQDVYAGIYSSVNGPLIQDPTNVIAHHKNSIFTDVWNVVKNVPTDISSMVTGLEGIPHILMHLPQEAMATGELIDHLAKGDNAWLQKQGYLPTGEKIHSGWSGLTQILRALNDNGSKQLLPFLPFISDLADLTNGQGRQFLQQHPVGALLDILPGITKVARLPLDSVALEANAEERAAYLKDLMNNQGMSEKDARNKVNMEMPADYSNIYRSSAAGSRDPSVPTKRFWAAGRAIQLGNPIKALVSAAGDVIPAGRDSVGTKITLRDWVDIRASAAGLDVKIREALNRPVNYIVDELSAHSKHLVEDVFGKKSTFYIRDKNSAERAQTMYLISHGVNPDTSEMFSSPQAQRAAINQLSDVERADFSNVTAVAADDRTDALRTGRGGMIADPIFDIKNFYKNDSAVMIAWRRLELARQRTDEAAAIGDPKALVRAARAQAKAEAEFTKVHWEVAPDEWKPAVAAQIKAKFLKEARQSMNDEQIERVKQELTTSPWESDWKRLMNDPVNGLGEGTYEFYRDDAMNMWRHLQSQGVEPIWTHDLDPDKYDAIWHPKVGRMDKPETPAAFSKEHHREWGMYFGESVQNLAVLVTHHQMEVLRETLVSAALKQYVIPQFTRVADAVEAQYYQAITGALRKTKIRKGPWSIEGAVQAAIKSDWQKFDPTKYGISRDAMGPDVDRYITNDAANAIEKLFAPNKFAEAGLPVIRQGTQLYKFAVLTGVRHFVHVAGGGMMMMLGRQPFAPMYLFRAHRILRALRTGKATINDFPELQKLHLTGRTLSGIKERPFELGRLHQYLQVQVGANVGQDVATSWIHEAKQKGISAAEYIPNKLQALEEHVLNMYRLSVVLDKFRSTSDRTMALEAAHKTFVDVNGMSNMERIVMKQIFPFYAFTRHLFRYLVTYPVDYPLRAAIISQFAEGEQQDWTSGLPRSYMSLYWWGEPNAQGNIQTFDLKNLNPFRSFANDFSLAGFYSSLSPFLAIPAQWSGINLLSGQTQLYPGTSFNPQTGTLQATPPPGGFITAAEDIVPQVGLLDHYLKLTQSTKALALYDRNAYKNQLWNMLNLPFVPEVINVPYEKEITEMRRFRQAQTDVANLKNDPSAANINKVLRWNLVPWDNYLISPSVLANYYQTVHDELVAAHSPVTAPGAVLPAPPQHPATLSTYQQVQPGPSFY